jgi:hypothetical protein
MPVVFNTIKMANDASGVKNYPTYFSESICNCCGSMLVGRQCFINKGIVVSTENDTSYEQETDEYWIEEVQLDNENKLYIKHNSYIPENEDDDEW